MFKNKIDNAVEGTSLIFVPNKTFINFGLYTKLKMFIKKFELNNRKTKARKHSLNVLQTEVKHDGFVPERRTREKRNLNKKTYFNAISSIC